MERVELGPKKLHGRAYGAWVKVGAGSVQAWTDSRWTEPVQRNIYRLWLVFHSFLKKFSLYFGEWSGGGWPSGTTAPPPVTPKRNLFYLFFYIFSSSFPSLYSILNPKSRNTNLKLLDLKKTKGKKEKKPPLWVRFVLSCLRPFMWVTVLMLVAMMASFWRRES